MPDPLRISPICREISAILEPVTLAERTMKGQTHENNHEFIYSALVVVILAIRKNEAAYFFRNFALGFSENKDGAMFPLKTEIWIVITRTDLLEALNT
jgi:hypothetical protein